MAMSVWLSLVWACSRATTAWVRAFSLASKVERSREPASTSSRARSYSFWATPEPDSVYAQIAAALRQRGLPL